MHSASPQQVIYLTISADGQEPLFALLFQSNYTPPPAQLGHAQDPLAHILFQDAFLLLLPNIPSLDSLTEPVQTTYSAGLADNTAHPLPALLKMGFSIPQAERCLPALTSWSRAA